MPSRITGASPTFRGTVFPVRSSRSRIHSVFERMLTRMCNRCADDLVDECVMNRGDLFPGGEAIGRLHPARGPIDFFEFAVLAKPEVRQ